MSSGSEFQTVDGPATEKARRPYVVSRGSVERRLDDCWLNADAGGKQCHILVCSGRSDTEELSCAGIGT